MSRSGASIPTPGILTPANDASLNKSGRNAVPSESQNLAKRSSYPLTDELLKDTIVVKVCLVGPFRPAEKES